MRINDQSTKTMMLDMDQKKQFQEIRNFSKLKKQLLKLKEEILYGISGQDPDFSSRDVMDEGDMASAMINHFIGSLTSNNLVKKLEQVNLMLKKIDDNSYGYCIECGTEIPIKRLKVLPLTEYCISCQTEIENDY